MLVVTLQNPALALLVVEVVAFLQTPRFTIQA
jgi:hypothetical protein